MVMRLPVAALGFSLVCSGFCRAQPAFEVASIKPSDGHLGIDMKTYPMRLSATACSLSQLIEAAWSVEQWQLADGPAWLNSDRFDIEARTSEDLSGETDRVQALGRPAPRKMMLMLQTLLAERFNLKVHTDTRQDNVFALVVARGGPKLQSAQETSRSFISTGRGGFDRPDYDPATAPIIMTGHNASMEQLAKYLEGNMRRPVLNQTGIQGNYDFRVDYAPENSPAQNPPPFLTAFQDATGLKLNATKGPVGFLVVDHADKPSAN